MANSSGGPYIISFSGLDGSGKSTQIANLREALAAWRCETKLLAFWDDVVVLTRYREGFVHRVYKSEPGIGSPEKPVNRRDKNVRAWYLTIARHVLYFLDALNLRLVLTRARRCNPDVIVMDRYIYDELANLPLSNPISRAFVKLVCAIAPRPDVAFLLDADPHAARARKPEYPVQFMRECRSWYHRLAAALRTMTVIPPMPLEDAQREVVTAVAQVLRKSVSPNLTGPRIELGKSA
ncbi:MAG TPA: thymidylate kinase [Terriglobales bacterium]|nr:thymidylate kinase [Terriglobales bacterium]